jgi:hypothetical protein
MLTQLQHGLSTTSISHRRSSNIFRGAPILRQQTMGQQSVKDKTYIWGNALSTKQQGVFRLGFRNINSLPVHKSDQKNLKLISDIKETGIDCMGIAEINLAWQNLPYIDHLHERFRGSLEFAKFISANNRDPTFTERKQSGGTMMVTNGHMCGRIINTEIDKQNLGRWCSLLLRGKNGLTLRIITLYRAVASAGHLSAYQQQRNILLDQDIDTCPRSQLLIDLKDFIQTCKGAGEQIIVLGDFNEDVWGRTINKFFTDLDMRELILDLHGNEAPHTFAGGVNPIDGIFGTRNIQPLAGG